MYKPKEFIILNEHDYKDKTQSDLADSSISKAAKKNIDLAKSAVGSSISKVSKKNTDLDKTDDKKSKIKLENKKRLKPIIKWIVYR